jgi:hypothetical protein
MSYAGMTSQSVHRDRRLERAIFLMQNQGIIGKARSNPMLMMEEAIWVFFDTAFLRNIHG